MPSSQGAGNGQGMGVTVDGFGVSLRVTLKRLQLNLATVARHWK